jgi:predicted nucleic acid-binding protein
MRALLDTDVVLDLLLKRHPFYSDALLLWQAADQGRFERYVSAITPINAFYVARKSMGAASARAVVAQLLGVVRVCAIDDAALAAANVVPMSDFEDAVQVAAALASGLEAIVTRNLSDYAGAPIPFSRRHNSSASCHKQVHSNAHPIPRRRERRWCHMPACHDWRAADSGGCRCACRQR